MKGTFDFYLLIFSTIVVFCHCTWIFKAVKKTIGKKQVHKTFCTNSKWDVKQWKLLRTSTTHMAQERSMTAQLNVDFRKFSLAMSLR